MTTAVIATMATAREDRCSSSDNDCNDDSWMPNLFHEVEADVDALVDGDLDSNWNEAVVDSLIGNPITELPAQLPAQACDNAADSKVAAETPNANVTLPTLEYVGDQSNQPNHHSKQSNQSSSSPSPSAPGQAAEQLAMEFNQLSLEEKGQVFEDLHGVSQPDAESAAFLTAKLDDMDIELELIKEKNAYNIAKNQMPSYVQDRTLRLKFLRCVRYDVSLAADRFVQWFELKLDLFGTKLLTEEITMFDLHPVAQDILSSGKTQLVPDRDCAGRTLIASLEFTPEMCNIAALQFFFYFSMVICEDEATQLAGVVGVELMSNKLLAGFTPEQWTYQCRCSEAVNIFPIKFQGYHVLMESNPTLLGLADSVQLTASRDMRHRIRKYAGTAPQNQFSLMSFGIPLASLPFDAGGGQVKLGAHSRWLERRKRHESILLQKRYTGVASPQSMSTHISREEGSTDEEIEPRIKQTVEERSPSPSSQQAFSVEDGQKLSCCVKPSDEDVILGRGRPFQDHPGNLYLKDLIAEWYDKYNNSPRSGKMAVAEKLVHMIHDRNGRFLKQVSGVLWEEIDLAKSREKVAHGFRKKREIDLAKNCAAPKRKQKVSRPKRTKR